MQSSVFFFNLVFIISRALALKRDAADLFEGDGKKPIARIVELLQGMSQKLELEQKADQELKEKFDCWCKSNDKDKQAAIAAGKDKVASLTQLVEELGPKIEGLGEQIRTATQDKNANIANLDTANALRAKQLASFKEDEADLLGQISKLASAKESMEQQASSTGLLQGAVASKQLKEVAQVLRQGINSRGALAYSKLSRADQISVDDFIANPIQQPKGSMFLQQPPADFGAVAGILHQMADDFAADLQKEVEEEKANKKSHEELMAAKTKELNANLAEISSKTKSKTNSQQTLAKSKQILKATKKSLAEDIKFQAEVEKRCAGNDMQYQTRMQDRAEEIEAVSKTMGVLMEDDARSLLRKSVSFLQDSSHSQSARAKAAGDLLVAAGQKLGMKELVTLGLESKINSFTKVKEAIEKMVKTLKSQQKDEVQQRDLCTADFSTNELATQDKEQLKDTAKGEIQALKTSIAKYGTSIESLQAEIAEMQKQVQTAGQARKQENADFQTNSQEQSQTQAILKKAVKFLQNVYGKGVSSATSFVQIAAHESKEDQPEMVLGAPGDFKEYKKNSGGLGAVSLIETIIQDSEKLQAEAVHDEQEAQTTYEEFVASTAASIKSKTSELNSAKMDKAEAKSDLAEEDASHDATLRELETLHQTKMALHKQCDFFLANFEVRQKAMSQEMEALANANGILGGANFGP